MPEHKPSQTALGAAALRAAHQILDADPKILDDPIVLRLLDASVLDGIRQHPERWQTPPAKAIRARMAVRSRFAEDELAEAFQRGIRQYLILGAGLDTFAYRQPDWAADLTILEADQPASQAEKRQRLAAAGIPIPTNLDYIAVDFETEPLLSALRRSSFRLDKPAFISWLGVTVYLNEAAIDAVFKAIALLPVTSRVIFSFAHEDNRPGLAAPASSIENRAAALGEPWITRFQPAALEKKLRNLGFNQIRFLEPGEIEQRYLRGRPEGFLPPRRAYLAVVEV